MKDGVFVVLLGTVSVERQEEVPPRLAVGPRHDFRDRLLGEKRLIADDGRTYTGPSVGSSAGGAPKALRI